MFLVNDFLNFNVPLIEFLYSFCFLFDILNLSVNLLENEFRPTWAEFLLLKPNDFDSTLLLYLSGDSKLSSKSDVFVLGKSDSFLLVKEL